MNISIQELETADYDILENIKTAFYRLWKLKLAVILATVIGVLASFIFIGIIGVKTTYYAQTGIYSAVYGSYQDSAEGVVVMNTYASMLGTTKVCERAAQTLTEQGITAATLRAMVNNGSISLGGANTDSKKFGYKLTLVASSDSAENVMVIANAMSQAFADEINDLLGVSTLTVLDEATGCSARKSINPVLIIVIFAGAALFVSAAIIFIKEFFSSKVYSIAQCEADKDQILGLIPMQTK